MDSKLKTDCPRREQSCIQYPQHFLQMLLISFASGNTYVSSPQDVGLGALRKSCSLSKNRNLADAGAVVCIYSHLNMATGAYHLYQRESSPGSFLFQHNWERERGCSAPTHCKEGRRKSHFFGLAALKCQTMNFFEGTRPAHAQ